MKLSFDQKPTLNNKLFESLIIRLRIFSEKMSKFKDNLIFWTAHAKLNKKLSLIIKNLEKNLE